MKQQYTNDIMRIFNVNSLIFTVLNMVFVLLKYGSTHDFMFIWISVVLFFCHWAKRKYKKSQYFAPMIMLIPIAWLRALSDIVFLVIVVIIAMYFLVGRLEAYNHSVVLSEFKMGIVIICAIIGLSILSQNFNYVKNFSVPYILIYIISTIILLRTLRYLEYGGQSQKINKMNYIYTSIVTALSLILCNQIILNAVKNFLILVISVIKLLFTWILQSLEGIATQIYLIYHRIFSSAPDIIMDKSENEIIESLKSFENSNIDAPANEVSSQIFTNIISVILIIVICYIIFKIYSRQGKIKSIETKYTESKEFIFKESKENRRRLKRFVDFFKIKSKEEKIRLYYSKFVKNCEERNIQILPSDTTKDINIKARAVYDSKLIGEIREIYIRVRYGQYKVDGITYKKFVKCYTELMKNT